MRPGHLSLLESPTLGCVPGAHALGRRPRGSARDGGYLVEAAGWPGRPRVVAKNQALGVLRAQAQPEVHPHQPLGVALHYLRVGVGRPALVAGLERATRFPRLLEVEDLRAILDRWTPRLFDERFQGVLVQGGGPVLGARELVTIVNRRIGNGAQFQLTPSRATTSSPTTWATGARGDALPWRGRRLDQLAPGPVPFPLRA